MGKISALCGENLQIYSGNDDQILPVLSLGGIGVISVLSNIMPELTHNMVEDYLNGNCRSATEKQLKNMELINCLFSEVNPIPIKEALNIMGFNFGKPRLPLVYITKKNKEKLALSISNKLDY